MNRYDLIYRNRIHRESKMFAILLFFCAIRVLGGNELPGNVALVAGSPLRLTCRIPTNTGNNSVVSWFFYNEVSQEERLIFNGKKVRANEFPGFAVDNRTFDLSTNSVTVSNAGQYICATKSAKYSAYVIVMAAQPLCEINPKPSKDILCFESSRRSNVEMWCKVQLKQNWMPRLTWSTGDGLNLPARLTRGQSGQILLNSSVTLDPFSESNIFTAPLNSTEQGRVQFHFTLSFENSGMQNRSSHLATNNPDYRYAWSPAEMKYQWCESFRPQDTVVLENEVTTLDCTKDSSMKEVVWYFYKLTEPTIKRTIYSASKVQPGYSDSISIIRSTGIEFNLRINKTTLDHAGVYECFRQFGDEPRAQLTVLVSQPKCHVRGGLSSDDKGAIYVKPGTPFQVQCSVEYKGNCSPRTTCRTEDKSVIFNGSENTSADPNKVRTYTSNFTIRSNRLNAGDKISCGIKFPCSTAKEQSEVNYFNWLSPAINVSDFKEITTELMVTKISDENRSTVFRSEALSDQKSAEYNKTFILTVALSLAAVLVFFALLVIAIACMVVIAYRKKRRNTTGIPPNTPQNNNGDVKILGNFYGQEGNRCSVYEPIDEARMQAMHQMHQMETSCSIGISCSPSVGETSIKQLLNSGSMRHQTPLPPSPPPEKPELFNPDDGTYLLPGDRNKVLCLDIQVVNVDSF